MKMGMSTRELRHLLLLGLSAVVILWAYGALLLGPLRRDAAELGRQIRNAREEVKTLEAATANEASLHQQYQLVDQSVFSLRRFLPGEEELASSIELLSDLANQAQVKIQTIFPQRSLDADEVANALNGKAASAESLVYKQVLIQIDAAAGYHQLGTFLGLVEAQERPMRISSLRISGNAKEPKRHYVKLLLEAYFAVSGSGPAADGKPVAKAPPAAP